MEKERKQIHEGNRFRVSFTAKTTECLLEFPRMSTAFRTLKQYFSLASLPAIHQSAGTTTFYSLIVGELSHSPLLGHFLGASISCRQRFWSFDYRNAERGTRHSRKFV
jgi:hypothetical protein